MERVGTGWNGLEYVGMACSEVHASLEEDGTVTFQGDSDALISKGRSLRARLRRDVKNVRPRFGCPPGAVFERLHSRRNCWCSARIHQGEG